MTSEKGKDFDHFSFNKKKSSIFAKYSRTMILEHNADNKTKKNNKQGIIRYKYIYDAQPSKCPICGRRTLLDVVRNDSYHGIKRIGDNLVWCCSDNEIELLNTKVCGLCGQPVYIQDCGLDDSQYFFIYMSAFIGWVGETHHICISLNLLTKKVYCTVFEGGKYKENKLNWLFKLWLIHNQQALLHFSFKKEPIACDGSFYTFKVMTNSDSNNYFFRYDHIPPLFRRLVRLINQ